MKEINIAAILKDKPKGTKLYTDAFGELSIEDIFAEDELGINLSTNDGDDLYFYNDGKYNVHGEPILFPSKEMRDWSKFAWKKGDVLVNSRGLKILFDRWANDNYTSFYAKTINLVEDGFLDTNLHTLVSEKEAKSFIKCIEEKLGGKLNRETLEIEKPKKPVFEIGKLYVFDEEDEDGNVTVIGNLIDKDESEDTLTFGNQYEIETEKFVTDKAFDLRISVHEELREATENEVELFSKHYSILLEKEKEAMAQPDFKPFDKVLVRSGKGCKWLPAFFVRDHGDEFAWRYNVFPIHSGKPADFAYCIPFEGHEDFVFTDYDFVDMPF